MPAVPLPDVRARFFDANGNPLSGGMVYSYQSGTSAPLATYTDSSMGTPNANPVVLDSNGYADIWLGDSTYRIVVKDSTGVEISTTDNVPGAIPLLEVISSPSGSSVAIGTGAKNFTVDPDKGFSTGAFVIITYNTDSTNYMFGQITGYSGTSLAVNVTSTGGSGNYNDWTVSLSGPQGVIGPTGLPGGTTGDISYSFAAAKEGWYLLTDGCSIGSASSGATYAEAAAQALYTLMWNNVSDSYAPVATGRGASAAADWAANKPLTLPPVPGRAIIAAGSGSGLTTRALGDSGGEETHTSTLTETASHDHDNPDGAELSESTVSSPGGVNKTVVFDTTTGSAGGDGAHNNMQPWIAMNCFIKN